MGMGLIFIIFALRLATIFLSFFYFYGFGAATLWLGIRLPFSGFRAAAIGLGICLPFHGFWDVKECFVFANLTSGSKTKG